MAKALRLRRLNSFKEYDKEEHIFQNYLAHENDFDSIKNELIAQEMEI